MTNAYFLLDTFLHNKIITTIIKKINLDGGYTEWTQYTECSAQCENQAGSQVRTRSCTSPEPQENGLTCLQQGLGDNREEIRCNGTIALQTTDPEKDCYNSPHSLLHRASLNDDASDNELV